LDLFGLFSLFSLFSKPKKPDEHEKLKNKKGGPTTSLLKPDQ
jgi:hypothetical protein